MFSEKRLGGWWEGGGAKLFLTEQRGARTNFFCFGGGVLSKFLLDNSSFSAPPPPPDNYCTVPKICSRLLESKKVAPNAKSCSKVAEHNRERPKGNPPVHIISHFNLITFI